MVGDDPTLLVSKISALGREVRRINDPRTRECLAMIQEIMEDIVMGNTHADQSPTMGLVEITRRLRVER